MDKNILLIEDEQIFIENYLKKLKPHFRVSLATNGKEGWKKIQQENPDLVLLDLFLPKMQGGEILQKTKKNPETKEVPVIVITHLEDKDTYKKIKKIADVDYLLKKDLSADRLIEKIKQKLS